MTAPGWYTAEGDPAGTQRWWDGTQWIGAPVPVPPPAPAAMPLPVGDGTPSQGARVGARLIDLIIMLVILMVLVLLGLGTPEFSGDGVNVDVNLGSETLDSRLEYLLWGIVSFTWSTLWINSAGATPGKKMLKMKIADRATGEPVSPKAAALRSANKLLPIAGIISVDTGELAVVIVGTLLIGVVSLVMLLTNEQGRTVMDRLSDTRVVRAT